MSKGVSLIRGIIFFLYKLFNKSYDYELQLESLNVNIYYVAMS